MHSSTGMIKLPQECNLPFNEVKLKFVTLFVTKSSRKDTNLTVRGTGNFEVFQTRHLSKLDDTVLFNIVTDNLDQGRVHCQQVCR